MNIQIELISESDLADEYFNIVIDGLKPRETYRVEMYLSDYYLSLIHISFTFP